MYIFAMNEHDFSSFETFSKKFSAQFPYSDDVVKTLIYLDGRCRYLETKYDDVDTTYKLSGEVVKWLVRREDFNRSLHVRGFAAKK